MKLLRVVLPAAGCLLLYALAFGQDRAESVPDPRLKLVEAAGAYRGVPYIYGAESPAGFDCSGFVRWVYREVTGLELPRSARDYMDVGTPVAAADARPGDIFVFNTVGSYASHVAIYAGGGKLIHAVSEGPRTGVIESPVDERYWASRLISVRSVLAVPGTGGASGVAAKPPAATPPAGAPVAKPAAAPTATPATTPAGSSSIVDIGIDIPASKESFVDPVPTAPGTRLAFTLTNRSGKADSFVVVLFVMDARTYTLKELERQKVTLDEGAAFTLPAREFSDPGKYRLVVKGDWGAHLVERTFVVEAPKAR